MTLTRREFMQSSLGASFGLGALGSITSVSEAATPPAGNEFEEIYARALVGDTLVYNEDYSPGINSATLATILDSGITYAFYDVSVTPNGRNFDDCLRSVAAWNDSILRNSENLMRADRAADILRAKQTRKHAMVFLFQDAYPIDQDLGRIRLFYDRGVRVFQLTHNSRNMVGDGYVDRVNGGLSDFGIQVVDTMNELRMIVDLSHCGEQTTLEAIRFSRRPCAFTHVGCRALLATDRNKTDAEIRALADKGGVMGIFNMSCWLTNRNDARVDDVVQHIDHAVKVGGVDHVGFGSDGPMGGVQRLGEELAGHVQFFQTKTARTVYTRLPAHIRVLELNGPKRLLILADALARRGYKAAQVEKIIGGNFFRLFQEVVG